MTGQPGLACRSADGAAWIEIARPEALNALDNDTIVALTEALHRFGGDPAVRVIVLSGRGRAFCAGADIRAAEQVAVELATDLVRAIIRAPVPVVAAVHGAAAGLGCSIAMASDLVLMARSAYLSLAFTRIGLMPDGGASVLVSAAAGRMRASRMALLAERIDAEQAERWGLACGTYPDDEFAAAVEEVVNTLRRGPRMAYEQTKRVLNLVNVDELERVFTAEEAAQRALAETADYREGIAAFAERRAPRFTGC